MSETTTQTQPTPPPPTENDKCKLPDPPQDPKLPADEKHDEPCCCPTPPGSGESCFKDSIDAQARLAEQGAVAKEFADQLRELSAIVIEARADYTPAKYTTMVAEWKRQDERIAKLADDIACGTKCWKCLLECRLCSLLYDIRRIERRLQGTGTFATNVDTLLEYAQWQERNRTERQKDLARVKDIVAAWSKPGKTLQETLEADNGLIEALNKLIQPDPAGAIFGAVMTLIPRHLAIGPRTVASAIRKDFIDICLGDVGVPDDKCCGPDTGVPGIRRRLVGPLPYLVEPSEYEKIFCCLVNERYVPMMKRYQDAHAAAENARREIEVQEAALKEALESLEKHFKADLTAPIDCKPFWEKRGPDDDCKKPPEPETPKPSDCDESAS